MSEFKPVAWLLMDGTIISEYSYNLRKLKEDGDIPLFTQRTWVNATTWRGLTDEDKKEYVSQDFGGNRLDAMDWAEKRLKEKNT